MSPKLFAIYVDDLTQSLIRSEIGCMLDEVGEDGASWRTGQDDESALV